MTQVPTPFTVAEPLAPARLRVVAVLDTWIVSGPGRQLAALAQGLATQGVDLTIVLFHRRGRPQSPYISYIETMGVPYRVIEQSSRFDFRERAKIKAVLAEITPHIVQTHGYRPTAAIFGLGLLQKRSWAWIGYFHGATRENLLDIAYNTVNERLLPFSDTLVVLSKEHRQKFAHAASKVRLIHNAALLLPDSDEQVDMSAVKPHDILVGMAARLSYEKGADLLVQAIAKLRAQGVDAGLVIAGDGGQETVLRKQIDDAGIAEHVTFLGRISSVMNFFRQIDVLAIPSRSGSEGLPNVLLEAIRAGTPIVASSVAAVPEVLVDEHVGCLVPPGDVEALATGITRAVQLGRDAQAPAARGAVLARFSLERRVREHIAMYDDTLSIRRQTTEEG